MYLIDVSSSISPWIPLVISSFSLFASLLVAYFTNFKKSKPSILIGSTISIYPAAYQTPDELIWGATGILVPMTFFNWSPTGGSIMDCRINMAKTDNPNDIFDIAWSEFSEILKEKEEWEMAESLNLFRYLQKVH